MFTLNKEIKILLDSDVIRHFIKGEKLNILIKLYSNHLVILDVVSDELLRSEHLHTEISNFVSFNKIPIIPLPTDDITILKEFAQLKKRYGAGESACMAFAKYKQHVIASSNLKDIKKYCEENRIKYLSTMDILVDALEREIMTEKECDDFIQQVKNRNSRLSVDTINELYS